MPERLEQWHCPTPDCEFQSFKAPHLRFLPNGEKDPDSSDTLYCANCDEAAIEGPLPKPQPDPQYMCDGCGYISAKLGKPLEEILDLHERLDPGGVVPDGTCDECGALAYAVNPEKEPQ